MENNNQQIHFFIGKGGVGKSTVSALQAIQLAGSGQFTLLVSLDPAHNQKDIFELNFADKAFKVTDRLFVAEPDIDQWVKKYLKDAEEKLQANYRYQQAFSMKNYFKLLKYSPAVEEYAMLMALMFYLDSNKDAKHIVVDMPPTALSLRFFALPGISLKWLEQLTELRIVIQQKKEIISKLTIGKMEVETDKVMRQLSQLTDYYQNLQSVFTSSSAFINVVANPEILSLNEAERIHQKLQDIDLSVNELIINKLPSKEVLDIKNRSLIKLKLRTIGFAMEKLIGLDALSNFQKVNFK